VAGSPAGSGFDPGRLLRARAADYAAVALANIGREFPALIYHTMERPGDFPSRPRERTPVFFGSFDWHSCVEMHWLLVRLLRVLPTAVPVPQIRKTLKGQLAPGALAAEAQFIADPANGAPERPYGWGWALALTEEAARLADGGDPDGPGWAAALEPLGTALTSSFLEWLPKATYPVRHGVHGNSANGLTRALPYARRLAAAGDPRLADAITAAATRWFAADTGYPAAWEPSGQDFLSPALAEAELMSELLPAAEFPAWLAEFLPGLAAGEPAALFTPAVVSDSSDGYLAHLHGLNLSRAWMFRRLAEVLPADDPRVAVAWRAAATHAEAALPHVAGDHYMVEHWLAAYAVLLLS
jgi:Protein of unknown function (DUF2891)